MSLNLKAIDEKRRDLFDWIDLGTKSAGIVFGVLAAWQAAEAYKNDVREKIVEQRIQAFNSALTSAGHVVLAKDWDAFGNALDEFGVIKHGQALATIGGGTAYGAMMNFYNVGADAWNTSVDSKCPVEIPEEKLETAYEAMASQFSAVVTSPVDWTPHQVKDAN